MSTSEPALKSQEPTSPFGTFHRIITTHSPTDTDGSQVHIHSDHLRLRPVLSGNVHITPLFSTLGLPTPQAHSLSTTDISTSVSRVNGVVLPDGVNGQVTDVRPGFRIDYHRTNSVDYNVMVKGSAWLITPKGQGEGEERTLVESGEVVVQTGTLHAWEAGDEGARWVTVVVAALPVEKDGKVFEEVDFK